MKGFEIYGHIIYDYYKGDIFAVELLARTTDPAINIEEHFSNLTPKESYNWFLEQLSIAEQFYNETGIKCSINVDSGILPLIKEHNPTIDSEFSFNIEITQIQSLPEAIALSGIFQERCESVQMWLDDYVISNIFSANDDMLTTYQFDVIKVDKTTGVDLTKDGCRKLELFRRMVQGKGTQVLVEGVENLTQVRELLKLGYSKFQGFFFHVPQPIHKLMDELKKEHCPLPQNNVR